MPFYVDSQIAIPGTKRSPLVPVSHAGMSGRFADLR
jgi:hypothetical protein